MDTCKLQTTLEDERSGRESLPSTLLPRSFFRDKNYKAIDFIGLTTQKLPKKHMYNTTNEESARS